MDRQKRKSCQRSLLAAVLWLIYTTTTHCYAETPQEMTQLAQDYLLKHHDTRLRNPTVSITPLSATAQTAKCTQKIDIRWNSAHKTGNINLSLTCAQPKWQRYLSAKISGELPVVITRHDLSLGSVLTLEDVQLNWLPDAQVKANSLSDLRTITDQTTRQFIPAGSALTSNQLRPSLLIRKGDPVRILVDGTDIAIEMPGIALDSGEKGKQIRVQNASSGKIIKGNVLSADSVIVP